MLIEIVGHIKQSLLTVLKTISIIIKYKIENIKKKNFTTREVVQHLN